MNVLLIHDGAGQLRGAESVALDLMQGLMSRGISWQVLSNHAEFVDVAKQRGIAATHTHFRRMWVDGASLKDLLAMVRSMRVLWGLIRRFQPRVIHINGGGACQWVLPVAAWARIPTVLHLHAPWSRKMRFVLGLHHASHVVGVSRTILRGFEPDPVLRDKMRVIYNALPNLKDGLGGLERSTLGIRADQFVVALVGVLIEGKRPADAIEAMRLIARERGDQCLLLVVGEGSLDASLKALAHDMPVKFLGQRSDVTFLLRSVCDAVVLPSEIEAFSLVLLEAAAVGLPRIAADAGGNSESIRHHEDGLLFPVGDIPALAQAITSVMDAPELAQRLGQRGQERARTEYSEEHFLGQFEQLYARIGSVGSPRFSAWLASTIRSNVHVLFSRRGRGRPAAN